MQHAKMRDHQCEVGIALDEGGTLPLDHIGGLQPFRSLHNVELDLLSLTQGAKPFPLNGGVMDEDVFAIVTLNKAIALAVAKPLDPTVCHPAIPPLQPHRLSLLQGLNSCAAVSQSRVNKKTAGADARARAVTQVSPTTSHAPMLCRVFEASIFTGLSLPSEETGATLAKALRFVKLFFPPPRGFPFTNIFGFDTVKRPVGAT